VGPGPPAAADEGLSLGHLVGPAVTLGLGWIVALVVYFGAGDVPSSYLGDSVVPFALTLAALAAPVALLLAWGEVDLSAFGMLPFAGYVYAEVSDSGVLLGLVAAGAAGLLIGAVVGVVRWATRAPSAVVSLGAGFVLQAVAFTLLGDESPLRTLVEGHVSGSGLPLLAALGFTAVTVAVAVALRGRGGHEPAGGPRGPEVVVGFGLSGAAAATYGALVAGMTGAVTLTDGSSLLLTLFAAVAVGGVVRGNRIVGPITAALGAIAVQLILSGGALREWDFGDRNLAIAALLALCLVLAHALARLVSAPESG
jgi:ribose/xylose/arabinose/galactoside ABC-type transport system permease subunit